MIEVKNYMEKYVPKPGDTIVDGRRMLVIATNSNGLCFVIEYEKSYFGRKWNRCDDDPATKMASVEVSALVNHMGWKVL